ncbi:LacI family DNA-binding transcriptional regulator [Nocardia sp. NPDC023852]|uniref:LacI family DNA-binding transcriptional regulator n=1 Tax=Nocardia sp. NPDC023852 TaxID=3154697 RepID=UPI0033FAB5A5
MSDRIRGMHPRRVTIRTVADAARVSTATVSRVMSGADTVNTELAARVRRVAEELAYRPSEAARSLARGGLRHVGILMPDLGNSYFHDIAKHMHRAAAQAGFRMLIADHTGDPGDEFATAWDLMGHVDGLALLSSRITPTSLKELARQSIPVVLVNRMELGVDLPMVGVDGFTGMLELCAHLADLGHRQVVYLSGSDHSWQDRERWRGIQTSSFLGIEAVRVECDGTIEAGYLAIEQALTHHPTALICFNDLSAIGAISKLRKLGIGVPSDISVTGFDDITIGRHVHPALTTVDSPRAELGRQAWSLLHAALDQQRSAEVSTLLPTSLIKRQSTGPNTKTGKPPRKLH